MFRHRLPPGVNLLIAALLGAACTGAAPRPPSLAARPGDLVIADVTVVPMDRDGVLAHRTVVVRGDRIVAVEPADADRHPRRRASHRRRRQVAAARPRRHARPHLERARPDAVRRRGRDDRAQHVRQRAAPRVARRARARRAVWTDARHREPDHRRRSAGVARQHRPVEPRRRRPHRRRAEGQGLRLPEAVRAAVARGVRRARGGGQAARPDARGPHAERGRAGPCPRVRAADDRAPRRLAAGAPARRRAPAGRRRPARPARAAAPDRRGAHPGARAADDRRRRVELPDAGRARSDGRARGPPRRARARPLAALRLAVRRRAVGPEGRLPAALEDRGGLRRDARIERRPPARSPPRCSPPARRSSSAPTPATRS